MTSEKKFSELLGEAPLATNEGTISLVGALQRSHEKGKFVLVLDGGQNVTLDIDGVKEYQVLGEMIGQKVVRIEIDRDKVPSGLTEFGRFPKNPWTDLPQMHQGVGDPASLAVPFALLTSHHASPSAVAGIFKTSDNNTNNTVAYKDVVTNIYETIGPEGINISFPWSDRF